MPIYITRHGQVRTDLPPEDGQPEPPRGDWRLTRLGREQADRLGRRLKDDGFRGRILSSPYRRAVGTADIVAEIVDAEVAVEPLMREFVGSPEQMALFRGATLDELRQEFPRVNPEQALAWPWWTNAPESDEDVEARVAPLVESLADEAEDVLLVGHGASVHGATCYVLRRHAPELMPKCPPSWNCILTGFRLRPSFEALHLADTDHLQPDKVTSNHFTPESWREYVESQGQ